MMIVWNERSVRWFRNASEHTGYNKKLAEIILEQIPSRKSLCDMGCGAGLIDFELASQIEQITCVDISQEAVSAVERQAQELGLTNVTAKCMDGTKAEGQWETVMALFHGGKEVFSKYFHLAKDQLILGAHGSLTGSFGPEGRKVMKCFDTNAVRDYLDSLGVKYHLQELSLEYGQPMESWQDAQEFVSAYTMPMEQDELNAYLEEKLEETGNERFPYYLPKKRSMGLFVIRRDENAQF